MLVQEIKKDFPYKPLYHVNVLKGGVVFFLTDLARKNAFFRAAIHPKATRYFRNRSERQLATGARHIAHQRSWSGSRKK